MKKKPESTNMEIFKVAALHLLTNKLFCEYMAMNESYNVEPEHFFEDWINRNVIRPDDNLKKWTWRYFMENLIAYRKNHKT